MCNTPVFVVESDPFPRLLQALLDAAEDPTRSAEIADFVSYDIPDYRAWLAAARGGLQPGGPRSALHLDSNWARIGGMRGLHGTCLGSIGLSEIGREVALCARAFGMTVLYHQRTWLSPDEERALRVERCSLDDLLARSDWLFPLMPAKEGTRGFLDAARLARMKRGAVLINVVRAELVEREVLQAALVTGQLVGLGLDTYSEEPARADDPLFQRDDVIIIARIAALERVRRSGGSDVEAGASARVVLRRPGFATDLTFNIFF